ncbi:HdeD family acid-resistance protein [Polynucleobacter necessarius]|uniref:HdeD family acid-resistance protein n=1 Tax=Polynucleobacter necessarius TaxID=576610 RepID=UPI000E09060F|nr:HdeD family acid-resistance protein [Polynucleobacter necessarius]
MTELNTAQINEIRTKVLGAAAKVPGALIGLGILFIVLGMIGVAGQVFFSLVSVNVLGIFLFAGGVLQAIHAFQSAGWKSVGVQILFAILYIVAAIYVWAFPIPALEAITLWLAAIFFVTGVLRFIAAFQHRHFGEWFWLAISAAISILMGVLIMNNFPSSSLWLPGLLIAIELLLQGWSLLFIGFAARSLAKNVSK